MLISKVFFSLSDSLNLLIIIFILNHYKRYMKAN